MYIDVILTLLFVWAIYSGWRMGAIKQLFSAIGFAVGLVIASLVYLWLGDYLSMTGSKTNMILNVVAFAILWIILPIALGYVANVLTAKFDRFTVRVPQRIVGAIVSLAKYVVLFSCIFNVMTGLNMLATSSVEKSFWYKPVTAVMGNLTSQSVERTDSVSSTLPDTIWVDMQSNKAVPAKGDTLTTTDHHGNTKK